MLRLKLYWTQQKTTLSRPNSVAKRTAWTAANACLLPITVWDVKLDGLELFLEVEDTINPQTNTVQILWCWEFILIGLDKLNIQSFKFKLIGLSSPIQILVHCLQLGLHFCFYILPNVHSGTQRISWDVPKQLHAWVEKF